MAIEIRQNPSYYSTITGKWYDSYSRAAMAELQCEAIALARSGDLYGVIETAHSNQYYDDRSMISKVEYWLHKLSVFHSKFISTNCMYSHNSSVNDLPKLAEEGYVLDILIDMAKIEQNSSLINQIDQFLNKFYPNLYVAYFSSGGIIKASSGLVAIFGRSITDSSKDDPVIKTSWTAPFLHVEKLFRYHEMAFDKFLEDMAAWS